MAKNDHGRGAAREAEPFEREPASEGERGRDPSNPPPPPDSRRHERVKLLFLSANAVPSERVDVDKEYSTIERRLRSSPSRDLVEMVSAWAVTFEDLQRCLLDHEPDIVHFAGHGSSSSELMLLGEKGEPAPLPAEALDSLFQVLGKNVSLVVLNACFSRAQAESVCESVGLAVGMSEAVEDEAAIAFSGAFYEALAYGRSVHDSFALGVTAIKARRAARHHVPRLLVRHGVDATRRLFPVPSAFSRRKAFLKQRIADAWGRRRGVRIAFAITFLAMALILSIVHRGLNSYRETPSVLPDVLGPAGETVANRCDELRNATLSRQGESGGGQILSPDALRRRENQVETFFQWAGLYRKTREPERAASLYKCVLELQKYQLGPQSLAVAKTLRRLGGTYGDMGEYGMAIPIFEESLAIIERAYGPENPELVGPLNDLAEAYTHTGDIERARVTLARASSILQKPFSPGLSR